MILIFRNLGPFPEVYFFKALSTMKTSLPVLCLILQLALPQSVFALRQEALSEKDLATVTRLERQLKNPSAGMEEVSEILGQADKDPPELARELAARAGWPSTGSDYARRGLEVHIERFKTRSDVKLKRRSLEKITALLSRPPEDASSAETALAQLGSRKFDNIQVEPGTGDSDPDPIFFPRVDVEVVRKMIETRRPVWLFGSLINGFPTSLSDADLEFDLEEEGVMAILNVPFNPQAPPFFQTIPQHHFHFLTELFGKGWSGLRTVEPMGGEPALLVSAERLFSIEADGKSWSLNSGRLLELFRENQKIREKTPVVQEALQIQAASLGSEWLPEIKEGFPLEVRQVQEALSALQAISLPVGAKYEDPADYLVETRRALLDALPEAKKDLEYYLRNPESSPQRIAQLARVAQTISSARVWPRLWRRHEESLRQNAGMEEAPLEIAVHDHLLDSVRQRFRQVPNVIWRPVSANSTQAEEQLKDFVSQEGIRRVVILDGLYVPSDWQVNPILPEGHAPAFIVDADSAGQLTPEYIAQLLRLPEVSAGGVYSLRFERDRLRLESQA